MARKTKDIAGHVPAYDPAWKVKKVQGLDLTGHKYGRLYVIRDSGERTKERNKKWLCCCGCGKLTTVAGGDLRKGSTTSCGCAREEAVAALKGKPRDYSSLVGNVYGKLTVLKDSGRRCGTNILYTCQCECGNITGVATRNLKKKNGITSCGCDSVTHGEAGHPLYRKADSANCRAKEYGQPDRLLASQVERLFDNHGWSCYYCGLQSTDHSVMTLDHVIPFARGGSNTIQNCVPSCACCNSSKGDMTAEEFTR